MITGEEDSPFDQHGRNQGAGGGFLQAQTNHTDTGDRDTNSELLDTVNPNQFNLFKKSR